jgi:flagellar motor protein MotB
VRSGGGRGRISPTERQDYLGSVSDVMSALIFIFVITLAVFALRLEETRAEKDKTSAQIKSAHETRTHILREVEKRLEQAGLDVTIDEKGGVLRLTERAIRFDSGSYQPIRDHEVHIGKLARVLGEVLPCFVARTPAPIRDMPAASRPPTCEAPAAPDAACLQERYPAKIETLLVEGHTDSQPIRADARYKNNFELSAARAARVFDMLVECEPSLPLFENEHEQMLVSVSGYANTRPIDAENRLSEKNRRIDLRFLMELPRAILEKAEEPEQGPAPAREVKHRYEG